MISEGSRHVAVWIDQHQAILLAFENEKSKIAASNVPGNDCSECRVMAHENLPTQQYYSAVLAHLEPGDEVLILGPGQAKRELCRKIEQLEGRNGKVVGLRDASRLVRVEVVFPTGEGWTSGNATGSEVGAPPSRPALRFPMEPRT